MIEVFASGEKEFRREEYRPMTLTNFSVLNMSQKGMIWTI